VTTPSEQSGASSEAPALSAAEQASIEVGQRGFTEPTNVNVLPAEGPQRPDYIPEAFWKDGKADLEGLAKSYAELQAAQAPAAEAPAAAEGEAPVGADGKIAKKEGEPEAAAPAPLATAMDKARDEWAAGQAVSEETVAELEAAGIPKAIFDVYLEGLAAITAKTMGEIHGFADGQENYDAMARWAAEKLSDAELNAYNESLDDPAKRENAVRGLYARYTTARPSEGKLITPAGTPSQAGDVYTDKSQLIADQKNPLYQTDASFRQNVMEKLQRSQAGGFSVVARPMFERTVINS
jgi:hypothetical protein